MNKLSLFFYNHRQVRTVLVGDEIWFVAKDICDVLDIAWGSRTLDPIRDEWKRVR